MKISLQLEADSADELRAFFATFQAAPALITKGWQTAKERDAIVQKATQEPKPDTKPVEPEKDKPEHPVHPEHPEKPEPKTEPEQPPVAAEAPVKAKRGRPAKAKPEETVTVMPATAPAVVASPAAPVQAAPVQTGNGTGAVSRQDLLDVFAEYVQRYGANFGYTDISGLLQKHIGEGVRKASDVPETSLGQAIAAIRAAILENPFNRKRDYA